MRLINARTLQLEEHFSNIPAYAILSHTWGDEEVTLQDWQRGPDFYMHKKGYAKIERSCDRAVVDGFDYLWCDTNCIDKTSSAELSEAINSMFAWYRDSGICYAYLADVPYMGDDVGSQLSYFKRSRWFTRGWTLQELLAPKTVIFYSNDWSEIGSRRGLSSAVAQITGIQEIFLADAEVDLNTASIAERMSWLAPRNTTRVEDLAYCVLGIFDINMPLLYGEGPKSFTRLQEEILRLSNDQTLFCWTWNDRHVPKQWLSMLSPSPKLFHDSSHFIESPSGLSSFGSVTYSMTNAGLSISLPFIEIGKRLLAILDVRSKTSQTSVAIPLKKRPLGGNSYGRISFPPTPVPIPDASSFQRREIFITARRKETLMPLIRHRDDWDFDFAAMLIPYSTGMKTHFYPPCTTCGGFEILKLRSLGSNDIFGGISGVWTHSDPQKQILLFIFVGAVRKWGGFEWYCKIIDAVDTYRFRGLKARDDHASPAATGVPTGVRLAFDEHSRNWDWRWQRSLFENSLLEPGPDVGLSFSSETYSNLDITATASVGKSVQVNRRSQVAVAQIRLWDKLESHAEASPFFR